jgi:hypothetical protein
VNIEHRIQCGQRGFVSVLRRPRCPQGVNRHAGVAHEHIEPTVLASDFGDEGSLRWGICDIKNFSGDAQALGTQLVRDGKRMFAGKAGQNRVGTS